jgi:hypothetical protein
MVSVWAIRFSSLAIHLPSYLGTLSPGAPGERVAILAKRESRVRGFFKAAAEFAPLSERQGFKPCRNRLTDNYLAGTSTDR